VSSLFLAFIAISLLLAVTPGPDMALVTRNALAHGPKGVFLTTTGIAIALLLWVTATAVGVAAVLKASTTLFYVLKLVGGAYLAYLGIRAWLASREKPGDLLAGMKAAPAGSILRQGLISAGTNPKLGVLFVTLLPQFIDPHRPLPPQLLVLGATFANGGSLLWWPLASERQRLARWLLVLAIPALVVARMLGWLGWLR